MIPSLVILSTFCCAGLAAEYTWPSPLDEAEDVLYLQSGYIRRGLVDAVNPCSFAIPGRSPGQQEAANWVRTAYHDMATHSVADGTGGLDASILFETDRPENVGEGFASTFGFLSGFYNIRLSMADVIALGVRVAVQSCGGPAIPFRAGRKDATAAGPYGVPQPQEGLELLTERFKNAGFNTSDMIAMVACGHTLGGVHGVDFPEITGNGTLGNKPKFEKTSFDHFDNNVVTEYLDNDTVNPLVVASNDTFNSDKRVFGADGNVTMKAMADPQAFQDMCKDILARMIDTVPADVTLSDVIEPFDVKPAFIELKLNSNRTLDFSGRIRVRSTVRNVDDLKVTLKYKHRTGEECEDCIINTTKATLKGGLSVGLGGEAFAWFEFSTVLDPSTSISSFNIEFSNGETFTNGGNGFPVQDAILYQSLQSCQNAVSADNTQFNLTVIAAVRATETTKPVRFDWVAKTPRSDPTIVIPSLSIEKIEMKQWEGQNAGEFYTLFKGEKILDAAQWSTSFDLVLGDGEKSVDFLKTGAAGQCQPL